MSERENQGVIPSWSRRWWETGGDQKGAMSRERERDGRRGRCGGEALHCEGRATVEEDGRSEVGWRDKNRRAARKGPGASGAR